MSRVQLARRIRLHGQSVDINRLESGEVGELDSAALAAIADELQWPTALLPVAAGNALPFSAEDPSLPSAQPATTSQLEDRQLAILLTEVEGLRALQNALDEWSRSLAGRLRALQWASTSPRALRRDDRRA